MADKDRAAMLPAGASVRIVLDGAELVLPLNGREFSTGSLGYHGQTKVDGADGRRYQVGVTATLIGSKPA